MPPPPRPPADPAAVTAARSSDVTVLAPAGDFPPPRTPPHRVRADVAVVGGDRAGSLVACCLRATGRTVAILDPGGHPRFPLSEAATPGESLRLRALADRFGLAWLPALTRHAALAASHPRLPAGRAAGFSYFHHSPGEAYAAGPHDGVRAFDGGEDRGGAGAHLGEPEAAWFLAARAVAAGAVLFDRTAVSSLLARPRGAGGSGPRYELKARRARGPGEPPGPAESVTVAADFLVDAGPPGGALRDLLGLPDRTAGVRTRTALIHGRAAGLRNWEDVLDELNVDRSAHPVPCGEAAVHQVLEDGWCRELRHDGGTTDLCRVSKMNGRPPPFEAGDPYRLSAAPTLSGRFAAAGHAAPGGGPARADRVQRRTGRVAGDGYALLPAAAGYIDPLHAGAGPRSAGGVLRLCTALAGHWGRPSLARELEHYAAAVDRELDREDALVAPCYELLPDRGRFRRAAAVRHAAADAAPADPDAEYLLADDPAFAAAAATCFTRLAASDDAGLDDDLRRALGPWGADEAFAPAARG